MLAVEPLPGITVFYNDFRMDRCISAFTAPEEVLCVDWCFEGRLEQPMPGGSCSYVSAGDLKIDDRSNHTGEFLLPTGWYRGATVIYEVGRAQHSIERVLDGFPVDIRAIKERLCGRACPVFVHGHHAASRIFYDVYHAPTVMRKSYCQVKALELLLFLAALDPVADDGLPYFPRAQVERVKAARDYMLCDLSHTVTVEAAARFAHMPLTSFKACFKGVYGLSPAAYARRVRMERAAQLLQETNMRVCDIGAALGYESPSKFSAAFKTTWGSTPVEYRRAR